MGMGNLAKMAQQMQADMARAQQELDELHVEGSAGGGVVKAVVTGKLDIVSITIDPEVVDPDDLDDLPTNQTFRVLRVFHLLADGDAMASLDEAA